MTSTTSSSISVKPACPRSRRSARAFRRASRSPLRRQFGWLALPRQRSPAGSAPQVVPSPADRRRPAHRRCGSVIRRLAPSRAADACPGRPVSFRCGFARRPCALRAERRKSRNAPLLVAQPEHQACRRSTDSTCQSPTRSPGTSRPTWPCREGDQRRGHARPGARCRRTAAPARPAQPPAGAPARWLPSAATRRRQHRHAPGRREQRALHHRGKLLQRRQHEGRRAGVGAPGWSAPSDGHGARDAGRDTGACPRPLVHSR